MNVTENINLYMYLKFVYALQKKYELNQSASVEIGLRFQIELSQFIKLIPTR